MRNRYPGTCTSCGTSVEAEAGVVLKQDGRWRTYCAEHEPRPTPPPRADHLGWHTGVLAGFDCETSSRDPREAFLVSAAMVDSSGTARTWLVDPGDRRIPDDAIAVHGITNERARAEGMPAVKALEEIADAVCTHLLAQRGLVIFNAPFDLRVLAGELKRHDLTPLTDRLGGAAPAPIIDPLVIDRGADPYRRGPRNLSAMCEFYGVDLHDAHTASGDASACLALAREIGARRPEIAALDLPVLHQRQVEWAAAFARDRQEWLDKRRPGHGTVVDGTWPYTHTD
ncbi:exonuclease domain-containing protein [Streptomonospora nanhaiensis]|uniref:DNA polymerase-3 subunit epsilon n=1 Tax=Streptomonospora nanhaiensis TaxID=1323731 RepID=A0A853BN49_9ACTN|nr:exonuclease domain-containing protein [Streptomonospora nanhaiensis]MBV2365789.1 DNA polymerase III subunit epsilon [Streptomonospora nanhaiensis]MBX9391372.1 DNA polymerase III subunit epsilon [Streptomonospora nanhaiensis]NYI96450.1 DNA polymerase-3 subunit epsilon [Streptomonospora nanhaiensis]